jgi:hypothetical protein
MAQAIYTQTTIAMVWDFDKTLIPGYSQQPVFEEYHIDPQQFWREVNALEELYSRRGLLVAKDTAYLLHMLSYVREGAMAGLTNSKLIELGARIEMSPGIPEFLAQVKAMVEADQRFVGHGITVEHYIVSTGIRHLIEGSPVNAYVERIWANEFVDQPPLPGYDPANHKFQDDDGDIAQIGYMIDNTSKTRAIFEINKGPGVDVNARMALEDRKVPIKNMIYIADGPSDVPVFTVVGVNGGRRLGVYQTAEPSNFEGVKDLEADARVDSIAEANFSEGTQAWLWLTSEVRRIATRICDDRDRYLSAVRAPARPARTAAAGKF